MGSKRGDAFRPPSTVTCMPMHCAISKIAAMKGDASAGIYKKKADELKKNVEQYLWNDSLEHFTDRFKVNNQYVHYWDFIRGRELAGMIPWYFDLPADDTKIHCRLETCNRFNILAQ